MLFDGRHLHHITDTELGNLVALKVSERQDLEYKATLNIRDDDVKQQILLDIAALANGGGGYLIVGITEDGTGKASGYSKLSSDDAQKISKTIADNCIEHISERIEGLEIEVRSIETNHLVAVKVPPSGRAPHMVTINQSTHFNVRHGTHKRKMTIGEIRSGFNEDYFGGRLRALEQELSNVSSSISSMIMGKVGAEPIEADLLSVEDGRVFRKLRQQQMGTEIGDRAIFWIGATPLELKPRAIDLTSSDVRSLLQHPPQSRSSGWNMAFPSRELKHINGRLIRGNSDNASVALYANGHMEFCTNIDTGYCWPQTEQEFAQGPVLNPYAICEFTTAFFRLYRAILDLGAIQGPILIDLFYKNIKGVVLYPGSPMSAFFKHPLVPVKPFEGTEIVLPPTQIDQSFAPDSIAILVLKEVYAAFGLSPNDVPFYNESTGLFVFSSSIS